VLTPVLVVLVLAATDVWVYLDAGRCAEAGSSVYLRIGRVEIATPLAWFVGCVVLWIFFFPMYVVSRSRSTAS
jgi:hypothetical protein